MNSVTSSSPNSQDPVPSDADFFGTPCHISADQAIMINGIKYMRVWDVTHNNLLGIRSVGRKGGDCDVQICSKTTNGQNNSWVDANIEILSKLTDTLFKSEEINSWVNQQYQKQLEITGSINFGKKIIELKGANTRLVTQTPGIKKIIADGKASFNTGSLSRPTTYLEPVTVKQSPATPMDNNQETDSQQFMEVKFAQTKDHGKTTRQTESYPYLNQTTPKHLEAHNTQSPWEQGQGSTPNINITFSPNMSPTISPTIFANTPTPTIPQNSNNTPSKPTYEDLNDDSISQHLDLLPQEPQETFTKEWVSTHNNRPQFQSTDDDDDDDDLISLQTTLKTPPTPPTASKTPPPPTASKTPPPPTASRPIPPPKPAKEGEHFPGATPMLKDLISTDDGFSDIVVKKDKNDFQYKLAQQRKNLKPGHLPKKQEIELRKVIADKNFHGTGDKIKKKNRQAP